MKAKLILLILMLAFVLRLYHLSVTTIGANSWRQSDTAAMARNYSENGYNFLYPQIDWGGASPGYVETEFPLYPFAVAMLYKIGGVHESFGRLLSVIFSVATIYVMFLLVRRVLDEKTALWTSLFLAILPLNVFYGRSFIPEPLMLLAIVVGVYFFLLWIEYGRMYQLILSATSVAVACLLKIPTLYIGLPLLYLAYTKFGWKLFLQKSLWLYAVLVLAPVVVWYYHAHQILLQYGLTFGIWEYGTDKWGNWDLVLTWKFWNSILFQSLAEKHFTWLGFPILVVGVFMPRRTSAERLFDWWFVALLIYVIIAARGNDAHD